MKNAIYLFIITLFLISCNGNNTRNDDLDNICLRGELRMVTLESAISYYNYGGDEMGFDFALAQNLADHLDLQLKVVLASSVSDMKSILKEGKADFATYKLPSTKAIAEDFLITNVKTMSYVVLVQNAEKQPLRDIMQLIGKNIYVQRNTKYYTRLKNLNNEIGGGINIKYLSDTLTMEEILFGISQKKIPFTLADNDIAELGKKYFKNIDIDIPVSIKLPKAWIVRKDAPKLDSAINEWYSDIEKTKYLKRMSERYLSRSNYFKYFELNLPKGSISPYDSIFRKNAHIAGWDWRLIAALAYNESRYNSNSISENGAMGVMQIMYGTGVKYGLNDSTFFVPEDNIKAGINLIASLNKMFAYIKDDNERRKVVLAAYNAGHGHILDAIKLTKKYGENHQVWKDNIEKYLILKSNKKYYNDKVVSLGYFRANNTIKFVENVLNTYKKFSKHKK